MIDTVENQVPQKLSSGVEIVIAAIELPADENFIPRDSAIYDYSDRLLAKLRLAWISTEQNSPNAHIHLNAH
jgi:hypothetical protein